MKFLSKIALGATLPTLAFTTALRAEPLPEGSYVDLLVVPAGPVKLAEFEADNRPQTAADGNTGKDKNPNASPVSGGSGVRVKEVDPAEIPPTAIYLKKGDKPFYQIPCFLNAVGTPVRTPVTDSEVTILTKNAATNTYNDLGKYKLPAVGKCVLVLLTKPLNDKQWTKPTVTLLPVPTSSESQVFIANASQTNYCGAAVNRTKKILLPALRPYSWKPDTGTTPQLALAMGSSDQQFFPPFYDEYLKLEKSATSVIVAYQVTPQESFRCAKFATGIVKADVFRPAMTLSGKKALP